MKREKGNKSMYFLIFPDFLKISIYRLVFEPNFQLLQLLDKKKTQILKPMF